MGVYPIGDQRVGVVRDVAVLDGNSDPVYSEFNEPVATASTAWVDNAAFEIQTPSEQQNLTVTTGEVAWAMLPIVDGAVPAVPAPIPFFDTNGAVTISANTRLIHNGLHYVMRGDAVLEQDIRGRADHVFCVCEREQG